ncbi:MAG TPA: DUF1326 domain-containing protein [Ilumatobacter sp.]|nr:DUF1326 domain-containing protein [Ilumatobacter sp.]
MAWQLEGIYVENCNCDVICPCTWSNLARGATYDDCRATLGFRIDRGQIDGVDVAGRTMVLAIVSPKLMIEGNWRAGIVFDTDTTDEQMQSLTNVFTGAIGGPMAGLAPLIGEFLGTERADIRLESSSDGWTLRVGDDTQLAGTVVRGPAGDDPVTLTAISAHPAGPTMTVTPSPDVRSSLLGIDFSGDSRSGFTAPFNWAA